MTTLVVDGRTGLDHGPAPQPGAGLGGRPASACRDSLFGFAGRAGGLVALPDGNVLVSDMVSGWIWHVYRGGSGSPLVMTPLDEPDDRGQPHLFAPAGLALAADGMLVIADSSRHRICTLSPDGELRVVAGGVNGYRDGTGRGAMFRFPLDVAVGPDGTYYVADTVNDRIRAVSPDGEVSTVAGSIYDYGDGRGEHARFRRPSALDVDRKGNLYVADTGNNAIRRISPDGEVTTLAGMPPGGDNDGKGRQVGLRGPSGVAVDDEGTVWVADHGNGVVRRISGGESSTELRLAGLRWPTALAAGYGNLFVAGAALSDSLGPRACVTVLGSEF
jgi:sugar lactone lactonase YvrE